MALDLGGDFHLSFGTAYIKAALELSWDDKGRPLAPRFAHTDLAPAASAALTADATRFQNEQAALLRELYTHNACTQETAGRLFWENRNDLGGYWKLPNIPDMLGVSLSRAAEAYGECLLVVHNGQVVLGRRDGQRIVPA